MEVEYGLRMQVILAYMFGSLGGANGRRKEQQTRGSNGDGSLFSILLGHDGSSQASS